MRAGISGIAAEGAVAAVVAAEIGQRQKDLPRIGDDTGLEVFSCGAGGGQQRGQIVVTAADQAQRQVARDGRRPVERPLVLPHTMGGARVWVF